MEYRIVEKEPFQFVGIKQIITIDKPDLSPDIQQMYSRITMQDIEEWMSLSNIEPYGVIGVTIRLDDGTRQGVKLIHHIGVATTKYDGDKWDVLEVPAMTWGVFTARGPFPQSMQQLWEEIYTQWLPNSGYELIAGPEMLWNEGPDYNKPDYHSEIWLPIEKIS